MIYRDGVRYRLKRVGRPEWLTDQAGLTDDRSQATDFASTLEAVFWCERHVNEPALWHWEAVIPAKVRA